MAGNTRGMQSLDTKCGCCCCMPTAVPVHCRQSGLCSQLYVDALSYAGTSQLWEQLERVHGRDSASRTRKRFSWRDGATCHHSRCAPPGLAVCIV